MKQVVRAFAKNKDWKYLLTKHKWKNVWVLPGWKLENKESIFKCIKRELKEEFNLKIKIIWHKIWLKSDNILKEFPNPISSYKIEIKNKKELVQNRIEYIFLCEIKNEISEIIIQEEEIWEYRFFSLEEIINLKDTFNQIKEIASFLINDK